MITIDKESKQRKKIAYDIQYFSEIFQTSNHIFVFQSPDISVLEKHIFYLLVNSEKIKMDPKYKMKPDYLSYDKYKTVALKELLMYINGAYCMEEFTMEEVYIPSMTAIVEVCRDKFSEKQPSELEEINW